MYVIVQVAGSQFKVEEGQVIQVPRLQAEEGKSITLDRVLLVGDGDSFKVGAPLVDGASVAAEVVGHGRTRKMKAGRFMRRRDYRRTWGYRQHYTELKIASITG